MNLEVKAMITDMQRQLDTWPTEKTEKIHELVSAPEIEKLILQLKSLYSLLKSNLDEA